MDITFNCLKCGQHIVIDAAGAGQFVDCPKCGFNQLVPSQSEPSKPSAVAESSSSKFATCPHCGKFVFATDLKCLHCGHSLIEPSEPVTRYAFTSPAASPPPNQKCPYCAETIKAEAIACRFCGHDLVKSQSEQGGASRVPDCVIGNLLRVIAGLNFMVGIIAGVIIGDKDTTEGWLVFFACAVGGIFVLGFAFVLQYLHAITYRLERIESMQNKDSK